jgi:hypothetical protein
MTQAENPNITIPSGRTSMARMSNRRHFVGSSDARIIMGDDEPALIRLWPEKRGEIGVATDHAADTVPQSGPALSLLQASLPAKAYPRSSAIFVDEFDPGCFQSSANSGIGRLRDIASAAFKIDDS